jgi:hypothetical protein
MDDLPGLPAQDLDERDVVTVTAPPRLDGGTAGRPSTG